MTDGVTFTHNDATRKLYDFSFDKETGSVQVRSKDLDYNKPSHISTFRYRLAKENNLAILKHHESIERNEMWLLIESFDPSEIKYISLDMARIPINYHKVEQPLKLLGKEKAK